MSALGGLTRDSIVGLNKLVQDDDDDAEPRIRRRLSNPGLNGSWQGGKGDQEKLIGLLLDDDAPESPKQDATFETSLNDGLAATQTISAPPSTPTGAGNNATSAATSPAPKNVSSTGTRALDSYRSAHYQGFQYEGYADYYSEDYNYEPDGGRGGGEKRNIFSCLFAPWTKQNSGSASVDMPDEQDSQNEGRDAAEKEEVSQDKVNVAETPTLSPSPSLKEMVPSEVETEPPQTPTPAPSTPATSLEESAFADEKKQEEGDIPHLIESSGSVVEEPKASAEEPKTREQDEAAGPSPVRGILKVRRCSTFESDPDQVKKAIGKNKKASEPSSDGKRHFLPTYEPKKSQAADAKKINFNPMARVLTIPSRKEFPLHQKAQVWWTRSDYDEFKKTGRIISKAMECGGSEIWLTTSGAWGNKAASRKQSDRIQMNEKESDEYNKALSRYVKEEKKDNGGKENVEKDEVGNKWWCKFGHSRRGLEHIASSSEGKARQQSVLLAIRMVMEEQRRQRASRTKDPVKLRNVSRQYTGWARDLSLAAGSADAEAVASGFDPTAACRAQHFAKRLNVVNSSSLHTLHGSVGGSVAKAVTSGYLDANAHSTPGTMRKKFNVDVIPAHEESLSRRAKGFIPGGGGNVSAAAVLSGMGGNVGMRPTVKA